MYETDLPVSFQVQTPLNRPLLDARMAEHDRLKLPEAVSPKTCIIVGSGPSARSPALWKRLYNEPDITTVACNGALELFQQNWLTPTYWACCDPQEAVTNFIPPIPPITTYLLATKCPESLFHKLRDNDVRIWRLDDMNLTPGKLHVTCAVSITLVAQNLMRLMGYHRFEMYGWDCCYLDGEHHASTQPEPEMPMDFTIEDQNNNELHRFKVCGSWAAELNDACVQAHNFSAMGYELVVHGSGAVAHLLGLKKLARAPDVQENRPV